MCRSPSTTSRPGSSVRSPWSPIHTTSPPGRVIDTADQVGEAMWPMPMSKDLRPGLDSINADLAHKGGAEGGIGGGEGFWAAAGTVPSRAKTRTETAWRTTVMVHSFHIKGAKQLPLIVWNRCNRCHRKSREEP